MPHVNVWVTMFAVQALQVFDDFKHGRYGFEAFEMV